MLFYIECILILRQTLVDLLTVPVTITIPMLPDLSLTASVYSDAKPIPKLVGMYKTITYLSTAPSMPPTNIMVFKLNNTAVKIEWDKIPPEHRNGIIREYKIIYRESCTVDACGEWKTLRANNLSIEITHLKFDGIYEFMINGATISGDGPWSKIIPFIMYIRKYCAITLQYCAFVP